MREIIFFEDFSKSEIDETKWNVANSNKWANNEKQAYTNRKENIILNNSLTIRGLKEEYNERSYTSARMDTRNKFDFKYGLIEVEAQVPDGVGTWPAIWMLGSNIHEVGWPLCGEIDIMEHCGIRLDEIFFSLHTKATNHNLGNQYTKTIKVDDIHKGIHKFGCLWEETCITWYIDEKEVYKVERPENYNVLNWPFNDNHFLLLNMAIGGSFCENKIVDEDLPRDFIIKSVKVSK